MRELMAEEYYATAIRKITGRKLGRLLRAHAGQ